MSNETYESSQYNLHIIQFVLLLHLGGYPEYPLSGGSSIDASSQHCRMCTRLVANEANEDSVPQQVEGHNNVIHDDSETVTGRSGKLRGTSALSGP